MAFLGIGKKKEVPQVVQEERQISLGGLGFNALSSYVGDSQSMKLSAVYAATNIISNAIAIMPIDVIKMEGNKRIKVNHSLNQLLNLKADKRYNHFQLFKFIIESIILRGEAYCYIQRDEQLNVVGLQYIDSQYVQPMPQPDGSIKYIVTGMAKAVDDINMLHFYMHCDEMYRGISLIKYASQALAGAAEAEKTANNFFKSGGNLSGIIKAAATLNNEQKQQIREAWASAFDTNNNKVNVAVLPNGLDYQPISVNPEDAQLLESRMWSVYEIARFFCIPPSKLGVRENVSYNSLEQDQLIFVQQTVMPYTELIENEMNLKLFKPSQVGKLSVEFDYVQLLKGDKKAEAEYYRTLITNGLMSQNEVRERLGLEPVENGDKYFMQLSYTTTDNIISGLLTNKQTQNQQVDNKVVEKDKE